VDGKQIGGEQTVTALHSKGAWQDITLHGNFGSGDHKVEVAFTNDLSGGSKTLDRNLYVDWIELNGKHVEAETGSITAGKGEVRPGEAMIWANGSLTLTANADKTLAASALSVEKSVAVGTDASKLAATAGNDMFVFDKAAAHDNVITGFQVGEDVLDLRGALKDAGYTGANALTDHVLEITQVGDHAVIGIDADGNASGAGHTLVTLEAVQAAQLKAGVDYLWH
jgi:Ca-dependent carbohydrate-binding module xylan-binding